MKFVAPKMTHDDNRCHEDSFEVFGKMERDVYAYILVMSLVTLAIRIVPLTLIRGQIKNRFVRSFLYYVPYVTLAVMTFPAIIEATRTEAAGAAALVLGTLAAYKGASLFKVSALCCITVFAVEFLLL